MAESENKTIPALSFKTGSLAKLLDSKQEKVLNPGTICFAQYGTEDDIQSIVSSTGGTFYIQSDTTEKVLIPVLPPPGDLYKPFVGMGTNKPASYSNILYLGDKESGSEGELSIFGPGEGRSILIYDSNIKETISAGGESVPGSADTKFYLPISYGSSTQATWIEKDPESTDYFGKNTHPCYIDISGQITPCELELGPFDKVESTVFDGESFQIADSQGKIIATLQDSCLKLGNNDCGTAGCLSFFSETKSGQIDLYASSESAEQKSFYFPALEKSSSEINTAFVVWIPSSEGLSSTTSAVGSSSQPVYITSNGEAVACTAGLKEDPYDTIYAKKFILTSSSVTDKDDNFIEAGSWTDYGGQAILTIGSGEVYGTLTLNVNGTDQSDIYPGNGLFYLPNASAANAVWTYNHTVKDNQPVTLSADNEIIPIDTILPIYGGTGLTTPKVNKLYFFNNSAADDGTSALDGEEDGTITLDSQMKASNHYIDLDMISIGKHTTWKQEDAVPLGLEVCTATNLKNSLTVESNLSVKLPGENVENGFYIDPYYECLEYKSNKLTMTAYGQEYSTPQFDISVTENYITDKYESYCHIGEPNGDYVCLGANVLGGLTNEGKIGFGSYWVNTDLIQDAWGMSMSVSYSEGTQTGSWQSIQGSGIAINDANISLTSNSSVKKLSSSVTIDYQSGLQFEVKNNNDNSKSHSKVSILNSGITIDSASDITLSQSTTQIIRAANGVDWWQGKDSALLYLTSSLEENYDIITAMQCNSGNWQVGLNYNSSELTIGHVSNNNYTAKKNDGCHYFNFTANGVFKTDKISTQNYGPDTPTSTDQPIGTVFFKIIE